MKKFYQTIVNNPKKILACFLLLAAIGAVLSGMVGVNYDIKDYLPDGTASTVSLDVMEEEFKGGIPNARVAVKNVTIPEALEYKEKILSCKGVTDVMWLDDAANILQPIETMDTDTVETYYKDNSALFTVTIEDGKQVAAIDAIRNIIGDDNAMDGDAVSTAIATTGTVSEINIITVVAILFIFIVLIITTTSKSDRSHVVL